MLFAIVLNIVIFHLLEIRIFDFEIPKMDEKTAVTGFEHIMYPSFINIHLTYLSGFNFINPYKV